MSRKPRAAASGNAPANTTPSWKDDPRVIAFLLLWFVIGAFMMFVGSAVWDTLGLVLVLAEAILILAIDRHGLYTMYGFVKVENLTPAMRRWLPVAEVILFPVTLAVYLVRRIIEARETVAQMPRR